MELDDEDYHAAVDLSARALANAIEGEWERVGEAVGELASRFGDDGLQVIVMALADTAIMAEFGAEIPAGHLVRPVWVIADEAAGKQTRSADEVAPEMRWAGRFMAARAAKDHEACAALVKACTYDEYLSGIWAMLDITARTVKTFREPQE